MKLVKPKDYEVFIAGEERRKDGELLDGSKPSKEGANDPGKYDGHLKGFATDLKNTATMGNKYKFVPKEEQAPG